MEVKTKTAVLEVGNKFGHRIDLETLLAFFVSPYGTVSHRGFTVLPVQYSYVQDYDTSVPLPGKVRTVRTVNQVL